MICAIEQIQKNKTLLNGMGRIGLVVNQSSTTSDFVSTAHVIETAVQTSSSAQLVAIFGPQHGYFQTEQDNMQETPDTEFLLHSGKKIPLYSLYSQTRAPTSEQLQEIDTLIVDLQDIGCRIYTYMLTLAGCLRSAAQHRKKVVVLDRPNPIGLCYLDKANVWQRIEGNTLDTRWQSFVGWYDIPMRHGMSLGELGHYFIQCDKLKIDYQVIAVDGLTRSAPLANAKSTHWTPPSPNIPTWLSAVFFPAFVALEGANVSEGRGTTQPFQLIGAPWLKNRDCIEFLTEHAYWYLPSPQKPSHVVMRPHDFRPTFNKHRGKICRGIQFHLTGEPDINLFALGMSFLYYCCRFQGAEFSWTNQVYEYNHTDLPINLILGQENWMRTFDHAKQKPCESEFERLLHEAAQSAQSFAHRAQSCFIYPNA